MEKNNIKELRLSQQNLTERYKTTHQTHALTPIERNVYLQSRMPATMAVCEKVLEQISNAQEIVTSILDLGCGPGSATYAAVKQFSKLQTLHLIDKDNYYPYDFGRPHKFFAQNFTDLCLTECYDLVVISYALSECNNALLAKVLQQAWKHTKRYLVIIEPGTPYGYAAFLMARQQLIEQGAFILAPCPHELACPLVHPDWCHFKIRLPRTKIHQQIKQGTKSFEDESYTFGIFAKQAIQRKSKRIIKKPRQREGHIILDLCTVEGCTTKTTISKKDKAYYVQAKDLEWGDIID